MKKIVARERGRKRARGRGDYWSGWERKKREIAGRGQRSRGESVGVNEREKRQRLGAEREERIEEESEREEIEIGCAMCAECSKREACTWR